MTTYKEYHLTSEEIDQIVNEVSEELLAQLTVLTNEKGNEPC